MSARFIDFTIDGVIGEPGEKGTLTYWSLLYQMNSGIDKGFEESEVINAVIQAIKPMNTTRIYLEGRRNLTICKVMRTMKSHFCEGDVRTTFKKMINATQTFEQTSYQFITSMFSMRDRILELVRQEHSCMGESLCSRRCNRGFTLG